LTAIQLSIVMVQYDAQHDTFHNLATLPVYDLHIVHYYIF